MKRQNRSRGFVNEGGGNWIARIPPRAYSHPPSGLDLPGPEPQRGQRARMLVKSGSVATSTGPTSMGGRAVYAGAGHR